MWVAATDKAGNGRCSVTPHDVCRQHRAETHRQRPVGRAEQRRDRQPRPRTDNLSGIDYTEYSLDGGANWTTGTTVIAPAPRAATAMHTITYRSRDLRRQRRSAEDAPTSRSTRRRPRGGADDPGSYLRGTVSLTASPTDPDIASVQFLYRPAGPGAYTSIGTDTTAPYSMPWITTGPSARRRSTTSRMIVTDTAGNTTTVALSAKTIDNTAPDRRP